jgi:hypothetical protein
MELRKYHLPQHRHTTLEEGWVGGFGYRKGYVATEDWNLYRTRSGLLLDTDYDNLSQDAMYLVGRLEEICKTALPMVYEERRMIVQNMELDAIGEVYQ